MSDRSALAQAFLASGPFAGAACRPLAGDASNRSYQRVSDPTGAGAVLMDAPPEKGEDIRPFAEITARLRAAGLSAPEILQQDAAHGFLLLEDLGDALFARVLQREPALEETLYSAAIDVLAQVAGASEMAAGLAPYDTATALRETRLLTDWYLPAAREKPPEGDEIAGYEGLVADALEALETVPPVCVLRDYHAENLIWLPERQGTARVGLLDYQDALAGHPAYDLVSLLEDARRDTSAVLRQAMIARHLEATGAQEGAFSRAYATWGAQRNLKIMGIFARLWLRDGKPAYLDLIPRVWAHLQRDLTHPGLAGLRLWVSRSVPPPGGAVLERLRRARR